MSYTKLILVPSSFRNIIFIAFHCNTLGGHFNTVRTLHRIRLCYYWPGMYSYIKRMCAACPGCTLSNAAKSKSNELVYNFPMEAPFMVLHVDAYMAGSHTGFEGSEVYLVACCGMCTFGALEPVTGANATTFASAIMKIQLRYGFCHTVILDKEAKFFGICREALDLLKINCHVLSGDNHNPMLVERLCRLCATKGIPSTSCLNAFSSFSMHGIHARFRVRIFLAVSWPSDENSLSRSTFPAANTGS
jgi:hypothetical protein